MIRIVAAADHTGDAEQLIHAYLQELGADLTFQHVTAELANLKRTYNPPRGRLFVAYDDNKPVGCVGLKPLDQYTGEIKRLYVIPDYRRRHLAQALLAEIITAAHTIGYHALCLDTLDRLTAANRLYQEMGFYETSPYYDNPLPGVIYYRFDL